MAVPEAHTAHHHGGLIQDIEFGLILDTSQQTSNSSTKELTSPTSLSSLSSLIGSSTLKGNEKNAQHQTSSVFRNVWICIVTALMTFAASFASSFNVPAFQAQEHQFHQDYAVVDLSSALYVAGQGLGGLIWGPLSEVYGRRVPLAIGLAGFALFNIPIALTKTLYTIHLCRFVDGAFSAAPFAIIPGIYVDSFNTRSTRGIAFLGYSAGAFVGPIVGPIIGNILLECGLNWRWLFWILALLGIDTILLIPTIPKSDGGQTHGKSTRVWPSLENCRLIDPQTPVLRTNSTHPAYMTPLVLLFKEPILVCIIIFVSFANGMQSMVYTAIPYLFENQKGSGSANILFAAVAAGLIVASIVMVLEMTASHRRSRVKPGAIQTKGQVLSIILGLSVLTMGLLVFGWTSAIRLSLLPQIVSCGFLGCGMFIVWVAGVRYITDAYAEEANSANAICGLVRASVCACFPLLTRALFEGIGFRWTMSSFGFVSAGFLPASLIVYALMVRIRRRSV